MDSTGIKRIITLYDIDRQKVESILDICPIVEDESLSEIVPLQIAIAAQVFQSVGVDPQPLIEASLNWVDQSARDFTYVRTVKRRLALYEQVAGGHPLRGNWVFGLVDDLDDSPILRCLVAFGDILLTPACGDDYDDAPMKRHEIMPVIAFARRTMTNIIAAYDDFCDEVAHIAYAIRAVPARPFNLLEALRSALQFRTDKGLLGFLNGKIDQAYGADRAAIDEILNLQDRAARARAEELLARELEMRGLSPAVSREAPDWAPLYRMAREATTRYEKAVKSRPDSAGAFCDLGCTCLAAGRFLRAQEAFRQALALASDDRRALGNLAYVQHRLLDDAAAAETLKHYLTLYDDADAQKLWVTCEKNARLQEARITENPRAPLNKRGLPQGIDIEEAMGALREAGEDVNIMNDCEILFLYELRFRNDAARAEDGR